MKVLVKIKWTLDVKRAAQDKYYKMRFFDSLLYAFMYFIFPSFQKIEKAKIKCIFITDVQVRGWAGINVRFRRGQKK